jgi:periplasmic divalent cation tolerance protein
MSPHDCVVVLTTLPATADGRAFGRALVDAKLAACVSILPAMESVYRWEGRVAEDTERQVVIKTSRDRVPDLRARVGDLHPYDVPEFVVLALEDGSDGYLRWIRESTTAT